MRPLARLALALGPWLLASACGSDPTPGPPCGPAPTQATQWNLSATGIDVTVMGGERLRYSARGSISILEGVGLLSTPSPIRFATGRVEWENNVSPGYFTMRPYLDDWVTDWQVVEGRLSGSDHLEVSLAAPQDGQCVHARAIFQVRPGALRVEVHPVDFQPRAASVTFRSESHPDLVPEGFLGFGERFNRTDQRGLDVYAFAEEGGLAKGEGKLADANNPWPNGQLMTYYPVPFFLSTRGYGFWLDSTWWNEFNLANENAGFGEPAWRAWHLGPSIAFEIYVPTREDPRPWPYQVIDRFTEATGRPMIPTPWSFGPRRRVGRGAMANGVPEIQAMRDLDLAITGVDDALHFLPAGSDVGIEDELRAWTARGRDLGYKVCGYYNSLFAKGDTNPIKALVDEGLQKGYFLRDTSGQAQEVWLISGKYENVYQLDFTSPEATTWYQGLFQRALDLGYSCWMYDFGEYAQPSSVAANGMSGEELHNLYPVLYQKAGHEALERGATKGDWFWFARSGYTGSQRWTPMTWSGDPTASFEDALGVPAMVRAAINMGTTGVAHWGSDIGGFKCIPDQFPKADGEMLTRWIQLGSMTSMMQDQNACARSEGPGQKASLWSSPEAQQAWKTYARLHTRLFPYLYTLAHEANRTGAPVVRHMFLEHPDRLDLRAVDDAYYLGPAILVAPVVERGARARTIVLPDPRYLDWQSGAMVAGGGEVTLDAPLDKLPLLLRDGQLVPLLDDTIDTLAPETSAEVVGPDDVKDVYDVVGFLSARGARFTLWDGGSLSASRSAGQPLAPPSGLGPEATREETLRTCDGCWRIDDLPGGVKRLRVSTTSTQEVAAGGLRLQATGVGRRVRWDLYVP